MLNYKNDETISQPIVVPASLVPVPVQAVAVVGTNIEDGMEHIINSDTAVHSDPKSQENRKLLYTTLAAALIGTLITLGFQYQWGSGMTKNRSSSRNATSPGWFNDDYYPTIIPTNSPTTYTTDPPRLYPTNSPTRPLLFSSEDYQMLDFEVVDAEYSKSLDSVILVSSNPNKIHILDPKTGAQTREVSLDLPPTCLSVGPNGNDIAVGHNGWVSYVDLAITSVNGGAVRTIPITTDAFDVVLGGNGFVYAFPRKDQWTELHSVEIETGKETKSRTIRERTRAKLHPSGTKIYGADNGVTPSDIERYDISGGIAEYSYDSPYHGDWQIDGDLWFSDDGKLIFVRGRTVLRSSDDADTDLTYRGSLNNEQNAEPRIETLDHSSKAGTIVLIPLNYSMNYQMYNQIEIYDDSFFLYVGTFMLPPFPNIDGLGFVPSHGKYLFFDASGDHFHVIVESFDKKYAIITIPTNLAVEYVST